MQIAIRSPCFLSPSHHTAIDRRDHKPILIDELMFCVLAERPDKPKSVIVSEVDSRSATVLWAMPYFGNSDITAYEISYKPVDVKWDSSETKSNKVAGGENMFQLRDLIPATTYEVRLRAENALGWSEFSSKAEFTTGEEGKIT